MESAETDAPISTEQNLSLRKISLEDCPCLGKGQNSTVYRLDEERILKLYKPAPHARGAMVQEQRNAQAACALGVPTPKVYEAVQADGCFGLIFELVQGTSLREAIAKEPERLTQLASKGAQLLRRLHRLPVAPGTFPPMSETYHQRADSLADLLSAAEIGLLHRMIDSIPEGRAFIHGDFHRGNLILREGQLMLIDVADVSLGHPLYDVLGTYMLGMHLVKNYPAALAEKMVGWKTDIISQAWDIFKKNYFQTEDPAELAEIEALMEAYCPLRWLTFLKLAPMSEEMRRQSVKEAREKFFPLIPAHIERFRPRLEAMGMKL